MNRTQYEIFLAIKSYMNKEKGKSPSMQDIAKMINKTPASVMYNLKKLREFGYITYEDGKRRSIQILKDFKITYE